MPTQVCSCGGGGGGGCGSCGMPSRLCRCKCRSLGCGAHSVKINAAREPDGAGLEKQAAGKQAAQDQAAETQDNEKHFRKPLLPTAAGYSSAYEQFAAAKSVEDLVKQVRECCDRPDARMLRLLKWAMEALGNITCDPSDNVKCGQAGGVEAVVAVLAKFQRNGPVQLLLYACAALRNITANSDNNAKCGAVGGVRAVVNVLRRFNNGPADPLAHAAIVADTLERACWALCNIALDADNRALCGAAGGVNAIVDVLCRHVDGPAVLLESACAALRNITANSENNKVRCGVAGGVEAVVNVLKRHRKSVIAKALLLMALSALANITNNNVSNKAKCCAAGGIEVVFDIVVHFSSVAQAVVPEEEAGSERGCNESAALVEQASQTLECITCDDDACVEQSTAQQKPAFYKADDEDNDAEAPPMFKRPRGSV